MATWYGLLYPTIQRTPAVRIDSGPVLASYFPFGVLHLCSLCSSAIKNKINRKKKKTTKQIKSREMIARLQNLRFKKKRQKNDGFSYYQLLSLSSPFIIVIIIIFIFLYVRDKIHLSNNLSFRLSDAFFFFSTHVGNIDNKVTYFLLL